MLQPLSHLCLFREAVTHNSNIYWLSCCTSTDISGKNRGNLLTKFKLNSIWHLKCGCTYPGCDVTVHLVAAARSRRCFYDNVANAGAAQSTDCLVKDRWRLPSTCLLGKPPHLPHSAQVGQSLWSFYYLSEATTLSRKLWRILSSCYLKWRRTSSYVHQILNFTPGDAKYSSTISHTHLRVMLMTDGKNLTWL